MSARPAAINLAKTIPLLVLVWATFVIALPLAVAIAEVNFGIQRFPPMPRLAGVMLLAFTALSAWAAVTLSVAGDGTPFPIDPPRALVCRGPYAYMRHPFVASVVGQVVAFGIGLGSIPVIGYAAVLMIVWYYGVRPAEERALDARFGDDARTYRRHVRGFRPRLTPYKCP